MTALDVGFESWMDSANCRTVDPARMQPDHAARMDVLEVRLNVCGGCPVRVQCREHAEKQGEAYGVHDGEWWGEPPAWLDYRCEFVGCGKHFVREPGRPTKYCSPVCKKLAEKARKAAA